VSPKASLVTLLFLVLAGLPFLPGVVELRRPKDDKPLEVDHDNRRDPRFFATQFRRKIEPFIARADGVAAGANGARSHRLSIREREQIDPAGPKGASEILVWQGDAMIDPGARLEVGYVTGDAKLGRGVRLQALASDGRLALGAGSTVERWIDANREAWMGPDCKLGLSASSGRTLHLGHGCTFKRLWGIPIVVDAAPAEAPEHPVNEPRPQLGLSVDDVIMWARKRLSLPSDLVLERDVVAYGEVRIGARTLIRGTVKSYGWLVLGAGARVEGNVISRKGVKVGPGASVTGNVFAERSIQLGPGAQVGRPGEFKTVYAAGKVTLAPNAVVFGWINAEHGGKVL
jgi:hypothetical protein